MRVVLPAVQDFPNINSGNYLEVEGTVTSWNYSDEDKNKTRAIGIMDNKTKKEIFVTVYSKGIQKGEYLRVRYLLIVDMERLRRISDENNRIIFYDISIWNNIYDNKQKV